MARGVKQKDRASPERFISSEGRGFLRNGGECVFIFWHTGYYALINR